MKNFFDEFDAMADRTCEAVKVQARRYVAAGAIAKPGTIDDLIEAKAALCAALRREIDQWRLHGRESEIEKNLMRF